jgi:hypothetical protein
MTKKGSSKIIITVFVVVLVLMGITYFISLGQESDKNVTPYVEEDTELKMVVKVCGSISDDYECVDEKTEFNSGDEIWFLMNVYNLEAGLYDGEYKVSYAQQRGVYDSEKREISSITGLQLNERKPVISGGYFNVPLKNQILSNANTASGEYFVKMKVTDITNGKEIEKVVKFIIK